MKTKYKALKAEGSHYIVGLYEGYNLIMTFRAYPDRRAEFYILYPERFILYNKKKDYTGKRKVHWRDIEF